MPHNQQQTQPKWVFAPCESGEGLMTLDEQLGLGEELTTLLWNRSIRDYEAARRFFRPSLDHTYDPLLMKDMDRAVARIQKAIDAGEHIMVYGDYDVDGTTAVALVYQYLSRYHSHLSTYIPDRYKEGYGLSDDGINFAADNDISLIIALDCGIKAVDQARLARELGVDLIICDHHTPGPELPAATAVLDPKRPDCPYPYKELSGCGIGFKLCQALNTHWNKPFEDLEELLDLLAVSIGADIVPITGENRVLAHFGLRRINENPRPAFEAIKSMVKKQKFSITDVVFIIAPRINAAGRMKNGEEAVDLMLSTDVDRTQQLLSQLEEHNQNRRELDKSITEEALELAESDHDMKHATVVCSDDWHKGVIGIVASRLIERIYRPTIVLTHSNGRLTGSARSVEGFDLYGALDACRHEMIQFGGHKYAAGMTIDPGNLDSFRAAFDRVVGESITPEQLYPRLNIDLELDPSKIDDRFVRRLLNFAPHGPQNDLPVFASTVTRAEDVRTLGGNNEHIRFKLGGMDCIGFGLANWIQELNFGLPVQIAYHIELNEFRGNTRVQLRIIDIRVGL